MLRIGAFELVDRPDVPVAVVIDEAVELAKRFSTDNSGRFVNGVLASLAAELRPGADRRDRRRPGVEERDRRARRAIADAAVEVAEVAEVSLGDRGNVAKRTFAEGAIGFGRQAVAWCTENSAPLCLSLTAVGDRHLHDPVRHARRRATTATSGPGRTTWRSTTRRSGWSPGADETFMTVRGLDFWGHHLNLVASSSRRSTGSAPGRVPLRRPELVLALGALPVYLIAKRPLRAAGVGLLFAVVYLMYAPIQWISWINFHPEALVIAPFLFAWWFAMRRRWGWFFVFVVARAGRCARTPRWP